MAFPYYTMDPEEPVPVPEDRCDSNLGDVVLCPSVVVRHAQADGVPPAVRFPVVLVHAVQHLLGHTHHGLHDAARMRAAESEALAAYAELAGQPATHLVPLTAPTPAACCRGDGG